MRLGNRLPQDIREIKLETGVNIYAEGSCLILLGNTQVVCTASLEDRVPSFLRGTGKGWITAEYGMLPRSTHSRMERKRTAESGRSQEISRLIGRSLRSAINLSAFGERQIIVDCDVSQADGGTRTASIIAGFVALSLCFDHMNKLKMLKAPPINHQIGAISCGVVGGEVVCDLDYEEDSKADLDANFIMTAKGGLVEIQATGETGPFNDSQLLQMMDFAKQAVMRINLAQKASLAEINYADLLAPNAI